MAISQSKYVNIISSVGGGSSVSQRELIGRVFTNHWIIPRNTVIEFGGGASTALASIGNYFGLTSGEYEFAKKYFSFKTSANTEPQKLSFAGYSDTGQGHLISGQDLVLSDIKLITDGTLRIKVDNENVTVSGLDFSACTSLGDVVGVLEEKLLEAGICEAVGYDEVTRRMDIGFLEVNYQSYASGTAAQALKLREQDGAILCPSDPTGQTPLECVMATTELSNNFFSFCFLPPLTEAQIIELAEWTHNQNVKYLYSVAVYEDDYASIQEAVKNYNGVALGLGSTKIGQREYVEYAPMSAYAAVDYRKPNSVLDIFYKQFDLIPTVTTDTKRAIYDPLRINYYGTTQLAGQMVSFYQDGVLQGAIPSMTVYANEAWLKDSFLVDILNLRMALDSLPANSTGKSLVMSALMETVNLALENGVVLAGKELDATQKAYITTITGDEDGWISVQNAGYRLSAEVEKYTENGLDKYKISFLFIYSKGDSINYVDGRDILI